MADHTIPLFLKNSADHRQIFSFDDVLHQILNRTLYSPFSATSPVYTPRSGYFWWTVAKMYVNNADGLVSQIVHHLVNSHLVSEVFVAATFSSFPASHPVYSILVPHFDGLVGINSEGFRLLTNKNGAITKIAGFGFAGLNQLIRASYKNWKFNNTDFIQDLKVDAYSKGWVWHHYNTVRFWWPNPICMQNVDHTHKTYLRYQNKKCQVIFRSGQAGDACSLCFIIA